MNKFSLILLLISLSVSAKTQDLDTIPVTFSEYMKSVAEKHPSVEVAKMEPEFARRNLQAARGAFDPVLFSYYDEKSFESTNYYNLFSAGVKVPTLLGITAKAGYDYNRGYYLNPENKVPSNGLHYLGLSLPLGQNLFFDARRAGIRQARIGQRMAENQVFITLNTSLLQASEAFWDWNNAWEKYQLYSDVFELAEERYEFTVRSFRLGDKAAIDTVEAYSVYVQRLNQLKQMRLEFQNEGFQLNDYLWVEDVPVQRAVPAHPSYITLDHDTAVSAEEIAREHPEVRNYFLKLDALEVERRLKVEKLKPKLNINYNLLTRPFYLEEGAPANLSPNDYKLGFEFSFPVLLREGRAGLQLTKLKISQQELLLNQKEQELTNKLKVVLNLLNNLLVQIQLQQEAVEAYRIVLEGSRRLYQAGEGSLVILNYRETSYLEAKMKLIDLRTKYYTYYYQLQYLKGEPLVF